MSFWSQVVALLVLCAKWPQNLGLFKSTGREYPTIDFVNVFEGTTEIRCQIVDSPIFTDTISISYITLTPSQPIVIPSTARPDFCPPIPNIPRGGHAYGQQNCNPITVGCRVDYTCNAGHTMIGNGRRQCKLYGWDPGEPSCERNICEGAHFIKHNCNPITVGCRVDYTCNAGHTMIGNGRRQCKLYGLDPGEPSCERNRCGMPFLFNGNHNPPDKFLYGDIVNFTCIKDYLLEGDHTAICQADRAWSGNRKCTYICPTPTLDLGTVDYDCVKETCIVNFACGDGYTLTGSNRRRCIENHGWSGPPPACSIKDQESTNNFQLTFDPTIVDMDDPDLEDEIKSQVFDKFEVYLGNRLKRVIVNRIYPNGTIDFTLVIADTRRAKQLLSAAFAGIARGQPFDLQGVKPSSNKSVLNGKEVLLSDPSSLDRVNCETLEYLDDVCPVEKPCRVLDDIADCRAPVPKDDNLWLILLLAIGLPCLALLVGVCLCCCYCCCCRAPAADDEEDEPPPITVKGFLPRYLPWGMPVRFNNTGMQGPIFGYTGTDRFSTPPTTAFSRSTCTDDSSDALSSLTGGSGGTSRGSRSTRHSRQSRRNNRRYKYPT